MGILKLLEGFKIKLHVYGNSITEIIIMHIVLPMEYLCVY